MNHLSILYIGIKEGLDIYSIEISNNLRQLLSTCSQLHLLGDLFVEQSYLEDKFYDLIVVQNSLSFVYYKKYFKRLRKFPVLFVSTANHLGSYVAPFKNLYGVINMGDVSLSAFGIPEEMQFRFCCPVEKVDNYYFYEQQPKVCRIVYCPTGNSIAENDLKLLAFLQQTNALLTIVSDEYSCLKQALSPFVTIVSRSSWFSAYKKAHLVVASGQDVVRAIALCKPCVVLGDYGLGGLVTQNNYGHLQSVYFRGRRGGVFGELVPPVLLELEIRKVFTFDQREASLTLQKQVQAIYGKKAFTKRLVQEIERITGLSVSINNRQKRLSLKPCLSSLFALERLEGKQFLMCGLSCFGEMDQETIDLLRQCDGTVSVRELAEQNGHDREELEILWSNLYELWKEKLILFAL